MERVTQDKNKSSYAKKLFIAYISCAIVAFSVFTYYKYYSHHIISSESTKLFNMVRTDMGSLVNYMNKQQQILSDFTQDAYIIQSLTTQPDSKKLDAFLERHENIKMFENILLIRPEGSVVFASKYSKKFQINLTKLPYKKTNLGLCFEQTMMSLTPNASSYSYDYILGKPSLYISVPVFHQKKLLGFIIGQINQNALFEITHNYFELGKTGEVVVAKYTAAGTQIIGDLRNKPGAAFTLVGSMQEITDAPIMRAVLGEAGVSVEPDYRGIMTVNARTYVPILDWGLVIKIDLDELTQPLQSYYYLYILFLISLIVCMITWLFLIRNTISVFVDTFISKNIARLLTIRNVITLIFTGVVLITLIGLVTQYHRLQKEAIQNTLHIVDTKMSNAAESISRELNSIMFRAQGIADDLSTGRLKKEDILIRMKRDLKENPSLFGLTIAYAPYQYNTSQQFFAPHMVKNHQQLKTEMLGKLYNYTDSKAGKLTEWYTKPIHKGAMWFEPEYDNLSKSIVAKYAVPFYANKEQTKPIGIIIAEYNINSLRQFMQNLVVGQTGYSFLLSQSGKFIYHPLNSLVKEEKTIFNFAQEKSNKPLFELGKKIIKSQKGRERYIDPTTDQNTWITFNSIPQTNWSLGVVFIENEIDITPDVMRQIIFKIILSLAVFLLLIFIFITDVHINNTASLVRYAVASSSVLFVALLASMITIMRTAQETQKEGETVIASTTSLEAYLSEQKRQAATKYQPFITIPTGIYLYSIAFPSSEQLKISGYVWQQYPLDKPDIPRDFRILDTIDMKKEKAYYKKDKETETIGWKIEGTIRQFYNYSQYPFDQREVTISLAPQEMGSTILLTPAMQDYTKSHTDFIGIPQGFKLSEYNIKNTFFSFYQEQTQTTFGLKDNKDLSQETTLQFNVVLTREILNALIVYLMPIFVILFSLYAVFLKLSRKTLLEAFPGRVVGTYSGLLFALIILHSSLRTKYPAGGFLYIEYFFFLAYITILVFILHALSAMRSKNFAHFFDKITLLLKIFFWPVQFTCWVLATMIAFY